MSSSRSVNPVPDMSNRVMRVQVLGSVELKETEVVSLAKLTWREGRLILENSPADQPAARGSTAGSTGNWTATIRGGTASTPGPNPKRH